MVRNKKPRVLVLVATFNRVKLLEQTLESISNQTFLNWECFIIDDFSTDKTKEVVEKLILKDSRFYYFRKPDDRNKGLSASRNYGLDLAKAVMPDYVQFFDDDDLMHHKKLEVQVRALRENNDAQFSLCGAKNFKDFSAIDWDITQKFELPKKYNLGESYLLGKIKFAAQVPLFRYKYAKDFLFDENLFYAEEWTLFSMVFLRTNPAYHITEKVLFFRRKHKDSITEGDDVNYIKKRSSALTSYLIFDYLKKTDAHTAVTLKYFAKQFLIFKFDEKKLNEIRDIMEKRQIFSGWELFRFKLSLFCHKMLKGIVLKLLKT